MASSAAAALDRWARAVLGLFLAGAAALLLSSSLVRDAAPPGDDGMFAATPSPEEADQDARIHRLLEAIDADGDGDLAIPAWLATADEDGDPVALEDALSAAEASAGPHPQVDLVPYSLEDVLAEAALFKNTYFAVVYDPEFDEFHMLYFKGMNSVSGCVKARASFVNFVYILRKTFPERFRGPGSPEFAVGLTSGDYVKLRYECLADFPHLSEVCKGRNKVAPVLQFGSVFRNSEILPHMIAMPMPDNQNLHCFKHWVTSHDVCAELRPNTEKVLVRRGLITNGVLIFGEESGVEFEDLIPQVVWRGTDFQFLTHITHQSLHRPSFVRDIPEGARALKDDADKRAAGTLAMREVYPHLLPRWQGVVLTAEAEMEAEERKWGRGQGDGEGGDGDGDALPWADMKFTKATPRVSDPEAQKREYDDFKEYGIPAIGESMALEELAKYKYHIDLGGGGGTTWTGTIQKLAMPGLLFHHVTPTKDYTHEHMKPWIHYVPVASDLSDLREKYDWAEAHPAAAKAIAARGSALVRRLGTEEGFEEMFEDDFAEPLRRVMEAYRPVSPTSPEPSWREVVAGWNGGALEAGGAVVFKVRCSGRRPSNKGCVYS